MANSLLTIDMITRKALEILENNLVLTRNVNRQYDDSFAVEGAKIGSNAVVVKDVPADATAVGIPARILDQETESQRGTMAEKMGFSAYAVSDNLNDPMTKAIHALLDHAVAQDAKLHEVMTQLNKLGADVDSDAEVGKAFDVDAFKKL